MAGSQNNPRVSVITVCYNAAALIEETICSVISQTYDNLEYIVIDGASTDGTVSLIEKHLDKISLFITEKDGGIYDAMNKGIAASTGDWVIFRNAGDPFVDERVLERFFDHPIPVDVAVLYGDCIYRNSWGYFREKPALALHGYSVGMPVLHPAAFVRGDIQRSMKFDVTYRSSADYDFMKRCLDKGYKFKYSDIPVAYFELGGFASRNYIVTFTENCRIEKRCKAYLLIGRLFCSAKLSMMNILIRLGIYESLDKKRKIRKGWKCFNDDIKAAK